MNLSSALVFSTRPRVSVSSTGTMTINDSGFSWEPVYLHIASCRHSAYYQVRLLGGICLPQSASTPFNLLFRQKAGVSLLRHHFSRHGSNGILTVSSICLAVRLTIRARLTLIRLTLIRNPWSFGVRVSRPHCRYLYLHLLFHSLQQKSPSAFYANGMLPYQLIAQFHSFGSMFMPEYYPRPVTRLVSCYALFK